MSKFALRVYGNGELLAELARSTGPLHPTHPLRQCWRAPTGHRPARDLLLRVIQPRVEYDHDRVRCAMGFKGMGKSTAMSSRRAGSGREGPACLVRTGPDRIAVSLHRLFLGGLLPSRARLRFAGSWDCAPSSDVVESPWTQLVATFRTRTHSCLRTPNDDLRKDPYNQETRSIAEPFGRLLKE